MGRVVSIPKASLPKQTKLCFAYLVCIAVLGCRAERDQSLVEYDSASLVSTVIGYYERQYANIPLTNIQQAFEATGWPYPDRYHQNLSAFGKHAGFRNSLYEKYVVVPTRFTNRAVIGSVVLLNAEPFPDKKGTLGRMIVSKTPLFDSGWSFKWYSEEQVRQIFHEAGQKIPEPDMMLPPADLPAPFRASLTVQVKQYFREIAGSLGIGRGSWWIILLLYVAGAGLVLLFLYIWFGRRGTR